MTKIVVITQKYVRSQLVGPAGRLLGFAPNFSANFDCTKILQPSDNQKFYWNLRESTCQNTSILFRPTNRVLHDEANLKHTSCTCILNTFASCLLYRVNEVTGV